VSHSRLLGIKLFLSSEIPLGCLPPIPKPFSFPLSSSPFYCAGGWSVTGTVGCIQFSLRRNSKVLRGRVFSSVSFLPSFLFRVSVVFSTNALLTRHARFWPSEPRERLIFVPASPFPPPPKLVWAGGCFPLSTGRGLRPFRCSHRRHYLSGPWRSSLHNCPHGFELSTVAFVISHCVLLIFSFWCVNSLPLTVFPQPYHHSVNS